MYWGVGREGRVNCFFSSSPFFFFLAWGALGGVLDRTESFFFILRRTQSIKNRRVVDIYLHPLSPLPIYTSLSHSSLATSYHIPGVYLLVRVWGFTIDDMYLLFPQELNHLHFEKRISSCLLIETEFAYRALSC